MTATSRVSSIRNRKRLFHRNLLQADKSLFGVGAKLGFADLARLRHREGACCASRRSPRRRGWRRRARAGTVPSGHPVTPSDPVPFLWLLSLAAIVVVAIWLHNAYLRRLPPPPPGARWKSSDRTCIRAGNDQVRGILERMDDVTPTASWEPPPPPKIHPLLTRDRQGRFRRISPERRR